MGTLAPSALLDPEIDPDLDPAFDPESADDVELVAAGETPFSWGTESPVILVVDDDEDARNLLTSVLTAHGMEVLQATSAADALDVLALRPVAAVVLDVVLPDGTGFDVCRALRGRPETHRLPVLMLTALTRLTDEIDGVLAGADAYLVKPVSRRRLLLHLRDLI